MKAFKARIQETGLMLLGVAVSSFGSMVLIGMALAVLLEVADVKLHDGDMNRIAWWLFGGSFVFWLVRYMISPPGKDDEQEHATRPGGPSAGG